MKRIRVLLFIDILGSGGAQRQLVGLANVLKLANLDVMLLDYWDSKFYDDYLTKQSIPFEHCPTKGKWSLIRMFMRKVRAYKPNVVIAYLPNPSIIAILGKILSRGKYRLIVSERNTTQDNNWRTRLRMNLFRWANVIVPNSYSQQQFISSHYPFLARKVKTITNMIDEDRFKPGNRRPQNDVFRFVVVGRVVQQKNPIKFIKSVKLVKDAGYRFRIDWFGDPYPQSFFEECQELLIRLDLCDCFQFHPATQGIVEEYHKSDAFILPSVYEGFPNVLCEAMACGLPVLASNVCDNPHIMQDGINGFLIDPLNETDMAEKIQRMLDLSVEERAYMSKQSIEIVKTSFSAERFEKAYMQLIL